MGFTMFATMYVNTTASLHTHLLTLIIWYKPSSILPKCYSYSYCLPQTPLFLGKEGKRTLFWSVRLPNAGCLSLGSYLLTSEYPLHCPLIAALTHLGSTSRPSAPCPMRQRCCCCLAYLSAIVLVKTQSQTCGPSRLRLLIRPLLPKNIRRPS